LVEVNVTITDRADAGPLTALVVVTTTLLRGAQIMVGLTVTLLAGAEVGVGVGVGVGVPPDDGFGLLLLPPQPAFRATPDVTVIASNSG
jgi:hypothetical protein